MPNGCRPYEKAMWRRAESRAPRDDRVTCLQVRGSAGWPANARELRGRSGQSLPHSAQKEPATPWLQTSGLQNRERRDSCIPQRPSLWQLVRGALENEYASFCHICSINLGAWDPELWRQSQARAPLWRRCVTPWFYRPGIRCVRSSGLRVSSADRSPFTPTRALDNSPQSHGKCKFLIWRP